MRLISETNNNAEVSDYLAYTVYLIHCVPRTGLFVLCPPRTEGVIVKWWRCLSNCPSVCLSVRLSVCSVPRANSRTERHMKPKIGRMEAHHKSNQWTYLEVKGSKVKVTKPINAIRESASNLPNEKVYKLQTSTQMTHIYHRQAPWP